MVHSLDYESDVGSNKRRRCNDGMTSSVSSHRVSARRELSGLEEETSIFGELSSLDFDFTLDNFSPGSEKSCQSSPSASSPPSPATWKFVATPRNSFRDHFSLTSELLGTGQFGEVRTCQRRSTGAFYACKTVVKSRLQPGPQIEGLRTEVALTGILSAHPNIAAPLEVFEDDMCVQMVMERCNGGDLFSLIESVKRIPEIVAAPVFRKVARAVAFCHARGIVHRDIKPENILLSVDCNGLVEPKLADFGLARILGPGEEATGFAGSAYYVAPEVVLDKGSTSATDIWSLGVVLYVMISGCLPFFGSSTGETFSSICTSSVNTTSGPWLSISESAKDLVRRMLCRNVNARPNILEVLTHDWLSTGAVFSARQNVTSLCKEPVSTPQSPPSQPETPRTVLCHPRASAKVPHPPSVPRTTRSSPRSVRNLKAATDTCTSESTSSSDCSSFGESGVSFSASLESSPRSTGISNEFAETYGLE